jgi:hypothetical protein
MTDRTPAQDFQEAMEVVVNATNSMGCEKELAERMLIAITGQHRTLQQSFFRVFVDMAEKYATTYSDLRNDASVDFAKKVAKLDHHFPFV